MKYSTFLVIVLLFSISNSYSQHRKSSKVAQVNKTVKISSFTVGNISKATFLRKKYKIEKVLKQRSIYAKKVSKAHRTCVNTRPKKDPVLLDK